MTMRYATPLILTLGLAVTAPLAGAASSASPLPNQPAIDMRSVERVGTLGALEREALSAATYHATAIGPTRARDLTISDHDLRVIAVAVVLTLLIVVIT